MSIIIGERRGISIIVSERLHLSAGGSNIAYFYLGERSDKHNYASSCEKPINQNSRREKRNKYASRKARR
jgi:hypothetical protein